MLKYTLATAPTSEPVSLEDAKKHFYFVDEDNDKVNAFLASARQSFENDTNRQLMTATYDLHLDCFGDYVEFPKAPFQGITSVSYYDENGTTQTISSSDYYLETGGEVARMHAVNGWPSVQSRPNAITIRFTCGYGAATDVPPIIKQAILMLTASMNENRENEIAGTIITPVPFAYKTIVSQYRVRN